jgi:hypothetical protein
MPVKLARGAPAAPANARGGYNYVNPPKTGSLAVELTWDANAEGSVTGYEVWKGVTKVCGPGLDTYCMDTSPASSGSTTYTLKTLYVDGAGASQSVSTSYEVTAPGSGSSVPSRYGLKTTTSYVGGGLCGTDNFTNEKDLWHDFVTSGGTATKLTYADMVACSGGLPAETTQTGSTISLSVWFDNTSTKNDCGVSWAVYKNAGIFPIVIQNLGTVLRNTTTPQQFTASPSIGSTTLGPGDTLSLVLDFNNSNDCRNTSLYYNSGTRQSYIDLPLTGGSGSSLATPEQPTGLSVTANGDGTRTLNWTMPSGGTAVDFYRVYRDGTGHAERVDTADATTTSVASASAAGATTLSVASTTGFAAGQSIAIDTGSNQDIATISSVSGNTLTLTAAMPKAHAVGVPVSVRSVSWTDTDTDGSSHTYRVTAASSALAESDFASPGAVTG